MFFNDLPLEIREIIIKSIIDKKSILNSRLVCREWYDLLKVIKEFVKPNIVVEYYFNDDKYVTKKKGKIIKEIKYHKFGKYTYKEFNDYGYLKKEVLNLPPYQMIVYEYKLYLTIKKIYDIRKDTITKILHHNYILDNGCNIS